MSDSDGLRADGAFCFLCSGRHLHLAALDHRIQSVPEPSLNDPAHPERSTPESFIQANTDPEPVGASGMDSSVTSGKGESVRVSFFCLQSLRFSW